MHEFLRFAHLNPTSITTSLVLGVIFGYLGHEARNNSERYFKTLLAALVVGTSVCQLGKVQGWR